MTRAPFYHEIFYVNYANEEERKFLKDLPDKIRKNESKLYGDLKSHMASVNTKDQTFFYETFPGMSNDAWDNLRFPSTTFMDDQAIVRFPVRDYARGQALRAEIGAHDLLRKPPEPPKKDNEENTENE